MWRRGGGLAVAVTLGLSLTLATPLARPQAAQAAAAPICTSATHYHQALAARMSKRIQAAMRGRSSLVGLAVDDRRTGVTCAYHAGWHFDSASVIKVTILSALLRKLQQEHRGLTAQQKQLATKMITLSDNNAATTLWDQTGRTSLQDFLNLAAMKHTHLGAGGYWGLTQITAHDELTLLKLLTRANTVLTSANCDYVLGLMAKVVSYERWGVPVGAPTAVTVHVKNGWLPEPKLGWRINSIGSFSGHGADYMIVVLTDNNPTMAYGVDSVEDIAKVINHQLYPDSTSVIPASTPNRTWGTPDEQIPAAAARR
jgi:hypothetical protein